MKFRLDFGRIIPGILLVISSILLFLVLGVAAVVAYLFSFTAGGSAALGVVFELELVPFVMFVVGVLVTFSGVAWWGAGGTGWLSGISKMRALNDRLRLSSRIGELLGVVVTAIVFLFLYENQLRGVAFFGPNFDLTAQFFFYAPLFFGMALSVARALYGRRNGIRPFDSLDALFLSVACFWLLQAFPFDFTHFGDMFPAGVQSAFFWLSNDLGRALLALGGIISLANFVYTATLYISVHGQLAAVRVKTLR